ncbi:hypothetical protein BDM02DRAFT_1007415 [Thelephora ganbajun]|uniref:Uncharacterized protein n=1 Tax=Thelephora ganbajun TaxID=370292 RepID=A0ACB6ZNI6_THEGA|nr:hypothetical protein BDM02DRAFT_1007415 [Thelephora ganbajun]
MSDGPDTRFDTAFLTLPPFSFTGPIPPFSTRDDDSDPLPTLMETPDFPPSMSSLDSASFDTSLPPTLTQTDDPAMTVVFPSSTGTLDTSTPMPGDPTSLPPTLTNTPPPATLQTDISSVFIPNSFSDSSITIDPSSSFSLSSPSPTSDPLSKSFSNSLTFTSTFSGDSLSTFSSTSLGSSFTTGLSSVSGSSFTTSDSSLTTSSHSPTPSTSSTTSSEFISSTIPFSNTFSSTSFPPPVTTTTFPTFGNGSGNPTQSRTSSGRAGLIVAVTTGAIAFAIVVALLAILCRKRYLKRVRQRTTLDPFLDLDGEMVAVSQPLIIGDGPGGAVYSDPFTDDPRARTQSRSLSHTAGPGSVTKESNSSSQAVVSFNPTPSPDIRGGLAAEYYNQRQPTDQPLPPGPPPQGYAPGIARSRSPQPWPQVQTRFSPEFPVPRQSSPPFDAGAIAYLRYVDQTTDRSPPSPGVYLPGNVEDHRLTSAFSVATELSPQYSAHLPPSSIDEMWRSSPDPIKASSSYRPSIDRRQSVTPSVRGRVYEPGDNAPAVSPTQGPRRGPTSPGSDLSSPYAVRPGDFGSRPSPILEALETLSHSQQGSNDSWTWISNRSGDTLMSLPVVTAAERVRITPMAASLTSSTYTTSPGLSSGSYHGESPPPTAFTDNLPRLPPFPDNPLQLPPELQVQPLSLGKKRSVQGPN